MNKRTQKKANKIDRKLAKSLDGLRKARIKVHKTAKKTKAAAERMAPKEPPKLYRKVPNSPIVLGETYTECVHGITGVATMYAVHLTGCNRVCLSRPKDKSSAYSHLDEIWTDETTLLKDNEFVVPQGSVEEPGHCGDHPTAAILGHPDC